MLVAIIVLTVVLPLPPKVTLKVPVIAVVDLFKVNNPESELILESEAKVINPP